MCVNIQKNGIGRKTRASKLFLCHLDKILLSVKYIIPNCLNETYFLFIRWGEVWWFYSCTLKPRKRCSRSQNKITSICSLFKKKSLSFLFTLFYSISPLNLLNSCLYEVDNDRNLKKWLIFFFILFLLKKMY